MANYTFIGGDQKQYGPVTDEQLRQWIREGRVKPQSQIIAEGDKEWRSVSAFPDFANLFGNGIAGSTPSLKVAAGIFLTISCLITLLWPLIAFGSLFAFDEPSKGVTDISFRMILFCLMLTYPWGLLAALVNFLSRKKDKAWCTKLTVAFLAAPTMQFLLWLILSFIAGVLQHPANK